MGDIQLFLWIPHTPKKQMNINHWFWKVKIAIEPLNSQIFWANVAIEKESLWFCFQRWCQNQDDNKLQWPLAGPTLALGMPLPLHPLAGPMLALGMSHPTPTPSPPLPHPTHPATLAFIHPPTHPSSLCSTAHKSRHQCANYVLVLTLSEWCALSATHTLAPTWVSQHMKCKVRWGGVWEAVPD